MKAKKKDDRMTVTNADKKANTPAYQKFKAGDKRYKAADHMGEEVVDEAMRPGERQRKLAAKRHDPYASSRDRATAHNVAVRNDGPGTPGYEKKSTGGKGARYAGYGDRGAGNKARRRAGQEPLRGTVRKEELSIDQQMKISRDAAKDRNPNPDHKAIRGKMLKKPLPKDTRTDAQKMTDATGPRPGSRYRGD